MATLVQHIVDLATRVATEFKTIRAEMAGISSGGGALGVGELPVRYDAVQPEVDCLWVSPTGQVVLITGSA